MAIITTKHLGQFRTESTGMKKGATITDAPAQYGGKGEYPTPVEIMAEALAACAMTTLCMAAAKAGVNTDGAAVEVENIERDPDGSAVSSITLHFHLSASIPEQQRKRLESFTQRGCTVGNSLKSKGNFIFDYE